MNDLVTSDYISYFVKSAYFRRRLDIFARWIANQAYLEVNDINTIEIIFPKLKEQKEIVNYLDNETQKIDQMTETVNRTIERLKEYRSTLITQAVTGKIDVRHHNNNKQDV